MALVCFGLVELSGEMFVIALFYFQSVLWITPDLIVNCEVAQN